MLRSGFATMPQAWSGEGSAGSREAGESRDVGVAELCGKDVFKGMAEIKAPIP